jgi:hypothetical protein
MRGRRFLVFPLLAMLAGCSLAEDVTPPSALATLQAAAPAGVELSPSATPASVLLLDSTAIAGGTAFPGETAHPPASTLAASPSVPPEPTAESQGTVRGRVINGTTAGQVPGGLVVMLHGLDGDQENVSETALADASGAFSFPGLEAVVGRLYSVSAEYLGASYASEAAHLPADGSPLDLSLTVYETTEDTSQVRVAQLHLIFLAAEDGLLQAQEIWVFSNRGDRTVVLPEGRALLEVVLPEGAQVQEVGGSNPRDLFTPTDRGFVYTTALLPGEGTAQMDVAFDVPYNGDLRISQPLGISVDSIVVLTEENGMELGGRGVVFAGTLGPEIAGRSLREYAAGPLGRGETLNLRLSTRAFPWGLAVGTAAIVTALAVTGLWWSRWRGSRVGGDEGSVAVETPERQAEPLRLESLRKIAELDDSFEAGTIAEGDYRSRRDQLKRKLLALMRREDD